MKEIFTGVLITIYNDIFFKIATIIITVLNLAFIVS
jgi:hypothetical protein